MTLPGGVILVFESAWSRARIKQFFLEQAIAPDQVQARDFLPNAFFVTTDPGLPSLELANALADLEGILISSPNWQTEAESR